MRNMYINLKKLGINDEKVKEICEYIINNRDLSYDEILDKITCYNVENRGVLNVVIKYCTSLDENLAVKAKVIIDIRYNEKNNYIDEKIIELYNNLFFNNNNNKTEEKVKDKEKYLPEIVSKLINGKELEEVLKEYGLTKSSFDYLVRKFLPKYIESYVDYKIFIKEIKPIDLDELDYYKEMIKVLLNFLSMIELRKGYENYFKTNLDNNKKKIIQGFIIRYNALLKSLDNNKQIDISYYSKIEDIKLKSFLLNYRKAIQMLNEIKTSYVSDNTNEKIYELYKKKVNI